MTLVDGALEILDVLGGAGSDAVAEVFVKRGRSRRYEVGPQGIVSISSQEAGWAVRAGSADGSFFHAAAGEPDPGVEWPEASGAPLTLPAAKPVPSWRPPGDLDAPLAGEGEARAFLEGVERELGRELSGARLLRGVLEDGSSEIAIANSRGVRAEFRNRAAAIHLEAAGPWPDHSGASLYLAEREARRFAPTALARRLATRLLLGRQGRPPGRERGEMLLAPAVAIRLLAGLLPLVLGSDGLRRARALQDRSGRIAGPSVTLIDDGRLPGGVLEAPVDGEGSPTLGLAVIEEGRYRQPLMTWRTASQVGVRASGCVRRPSWRDLPAPAPSHLYLRPASRDGVATLVAGITRGFYLVEPTGAGRFEPGEGRFSLPVCGFSVRDGRAESPVAGTRLHGSVRAFLQGIQTTARDLAFQPLAGMIGSPTLLVGGLELRDDE